MMGDVFIEQLVKKQSTVADNLKKAGILFLGLLIALFCFTFVTSQFFGPFAMLLSAGAIWGAYMLITSMNVEYEYIVTNGEMDLDKIIAKRKRKRLMTVKLSTFDTFEPYDEAAHKGKNYTSRVIACDNTKLPTTYAATFRHQSLGDCLLVFSPDERVLGQVTLYMKSHRSGRPVITQPTNFTFEEK